MFQPAQDRGQRARWKAVGSAGGSSSPDPESGEQWTPFGKVNLVPGGKKTQGDQKPSAVLSADICLSMCLSLALCVCVCAGIVSGLVTMGQGESTPLSLMTDHFSDVRARAHKLSLLVKKSKLVTFCSAEWPAFQVGWPLEGTFQPSIIQAVKEKGSGSLGPSGSGPLCHGL